MLGLLRLLNALVSMIIGWLVVVMTLVALAWILWSYLAGPLFGTIVIPRPAPLLEFLFVPASLGILVLIFFVGLYLLKPVSLVMRSLLRGVIYERVDKDLPLYRSLENIAAKMGVQTPKLFVYRSIIPNAFVVSSLFSSSMAVSLGLLQKLEPDEIEWVLAHELAHIKYFDAGGSSFRIASVQTMNIAWIIHFWVMHTVVSSAAILRVSLFIFALLLWPLIMINYSIMFVSWLSKWLFLLFDLHIGRAMEHRSDRIASNYLGPVVGIRALGKLESGIEPSLGGLFSTHPSDKKRIYRLVKIAEKSGLVAINS